MQLGFVTALFPELSLKEILEFAAETAKAPTAAKRRLRRIEKNAGRMAKLARNKQ